MKNRKRKRAEEKEETVEGGGISEPEGDFLSNTQPSAPNSVAIPLEPVNLSIEILTQINAVFTASTLVQLPVLEGKIISTRFGVSN